MNHFPVVHSIVAPAALASFITEKYSIKGRVACRLLKAGVNHSYLVTGEIEKYVFRLYSFRWRTEQEIESEIKLINHLYARGISVPYPVADNQGKYLQELAAPEGTRYGVMFSYAKGEKDLNHPAEIHFKVGQTMARIHQLAQHLPLDRVQYNARTLTGQTYSLLQTFLPEDSAEMLFMKNVTAFVADAYKAVNIDHIRSGIVHLDIWFDNLHVHNSTDINIFDFDFCGQGWLCHDLGYYIIQLYQTEKEEAQYQVKKESFLAGYESICPISSEEKRIMPLAGLAVYVFYLGVQCQRFDNWSNVFLNEIYLKRFINLSIKRWTDYNNMRIGSSSFAS